MIPQKVQKVLNLFLFFSDDSENTFHYSRYETIDLRTKLLNE